LGRSHWIIFFKAEVSDRSALKVSAQERVELESSNSSNYLGYVVVAIIVAVIAVAVTYYVAPGKGAENVTQNDVRDYLDTASEQDIKDAISGVSPDLLKESAKMKAGFIYVGPIGDYGWSHAHEQGRLHVEEMFPWLETVYVESVDKADCYAAIDRLFTDENCDVVFTTSFDFMEATVQYADDHPDRLLMHCSGYLRRENLGTYFADFYQLYYLNGLMAGALTDTDKLAYVGAFPIAEVKRHINAFALGAQEVNPDAKVYVRWIQDWYSPDKATEAANALLGEGCDVFAFTEDSPTIVQIAEESTDAGNPVYVFSHYSPMQEYGPDSCVSGQLVHWDRMYEQILMRLYTGTWNARDYNWLLAEGGVELGAEFGTPINPKFESALKSVTVQDDVLGEISVYDLVMERIDQMEDVNVGFDPFVGPIYDQDETLVVREGERASIDTLWNLDWLVRNVEGSTG